MGTFTIRLGLMGVVVRMSLGGGGPRGVRR